MSGVAVENADQETKNNDVDKPFRVLPVINGADTGNQAKNESETGRRRAGRRGIGRRVW
jgi:hypothetical protein